ncbi:hypothetical protein [Actinomadura terrae]|uniref:hypothetical protein n=1 Tax=Actinomadura terrae TaxID=604353 RepID=UPI001FA8009B|nr:hypothetical protein [Actinomadura terrae]
MSDTSSDEPEVRPFAAVLQELNRGQVHNDASAQLHALVDSVTEHGAKGTLTLTLEVAPIAKGDTSVLKVAAKVTSRPPAAPATSTFFVDGSGNLSRRDPNQPELPGLRGVDTPERTAAQ